MSPEFEPPIQPEHDLYGFTERERLFDRVTHDRFLAVLNDPKTQILKAQIDNNSFGEFLFVATKREEGERISHITFYGLGFHAYREQWIDKEWSWYEGTPSGETDQELLSLEESLATITERQADIASEVGRQNQSSRGKLYEMLADLTDEDGALTELEDLGELLDDDDVFL